MSSNYESRFVLICKPEQSGKTFIMIQQIIKGITYPPCDKRIVNIIFCDNNLLLTKQTTERVKKDLEEVEIEGESYLEFSSHSRTQYNNANAVVGAIITKSVQNVLCCTNGTRKDDIYNIISDLNKSEYTANKLFFKIWLDEADKYTNFIDDTFKPLVEDYSNVALYCITATPKLLFDSYGSLNVFPLENTTTSNYHGWEDNEIHLVDKVTDTISFIEHVLTLNATHYILPGTKWYIPGEYTKKSHIAVKNICIKHGFAVIIVNGQGIKVVLPDSSLYIYKKDDELNTIMKKIYKELSLERFPLAITGNICIGRGISIMSNDFLLDYGILTSCHNKQEASQSAGRLKGNIKHWSNYKKPIIFTTEDFNKVAIEWESKSRGLAELAFKNKQEGKSTVITKNEFKTLGEDYEYILHPELFPSFAQAQKFLKTKTHEMKQKISISKKSVIHLRDGYSITSRFLKNGKTVDDLTADDRITLDQANKIAPSVNISSKTGNKYMIIPVYESMESPPKSVQFQVRYISYKG